MDYLPPPLVLVPRLLTATLLDFATGHGESLLRYGYQICQRLLFREMLSIGDFESGPPSTSMSTIVGRRGGLST